MLFFPKYGTSGVCAPDEPATPARRTKTTARTERGREGSGMRGRISKYLGVLDVGSFDGSYLRRRRPANTVLGNTLVFMVVCPQATPPRLLSATSGYTRVSARLRVLTEAVTLRRGSLRGSR